MPPVQGECSVGVAGSLGARSVSASRQCGGVPRWHGRMRQRAERADQHQDEIAMAWCQGAR